MPKGKVDYSKGLIYKLCCKDPNIKEIYIGSTVNFRNRKSKHKDSCTNLNHEEYNYKKSRFIREHGGWENWEMILVEYYNATDRLDLRKRERYWFDELSAKLNSVKPYTSEEERKNNEIEYRENHKEEHRQYVKKHYEDNRDDYLNRAKNNYEKNRNKKLKYQKEYHQKNTIKVSEYHKEYWQKNKNKLSENKKEYREKNNERIECECGSNVVKYNYTTHCKTKKHIKYLETQKWLEAVCV
jgi:hypothetical protein